MSELGQLEFLFGTRDGATFDAERDTVRLNQQAYDVWEAMKGGQWRTLKHLAAISGHPEPSVSARLRDFRKRRFGSHVVERIHIFNGVWVYRLTPNPAIAIAGDIDGEHQSAPIDGK